MSVRSVVALALSAVLAAPSAGQVVTVAPGGAGADFGEIQPAVDAAPAGASVLIQPGTYAPFTIDKPLRLLGQGALVQSAVADVEACVVRDLPPLAEVVVTGVRFEGGASSCAGGPFAGNCRPYLSIEDCLGSVVLEGVVVDASDDGITGASGPAVRVQDSTRVMLVDCELVGNSGSVAPPTPALECSDSTVWLVGGVVRGGSAAPDPAASAAGAAGVELVRSLLYLARADVRGGAGGWTFGTPFPLAWAGGPGLAADASVLKLVGGPGARVEAGASGFGGVGSQCVDGEAAIVLLNASELLATSAMPIVGAAQGGGDLFCPDASAGDAVRQSGGSAHWFVDHGYPTLGVDASSVAPGSGVLLDLDATANGGVFVLAALATGPDFALVGFDGVLALDFATLLVLGGVGLDGAGAGAFPIAFPANPNLVGKALFFQGLELDPLEPRFSNVALVGLQ